MNEKHFAGDRGNDFCNDLSNDIGYAAMEVIRNV